MTVKWIRLNPTLSHNPTKVSTPEIYFLKQGRTSTQIARESSCFLGCSVSNNDKSGGTNRDLLGMLFNKTLHPQQFFTGNKYDQMFSLRGIKRMNKALPPKEALCFTMPIGFYGTGTFTSVWFNFIITTTSWWFQILFIFTPNPGEMIQFRLTYFSNRLKLNHQLDFV